MQAMSHNSCGPTIRSYHLWSAFIEEVTMRTSLCHLLSQPIGDTLSNTSMIQFHNNLSFLEHQHRTHQQPQWRLAPQFPTMILYHSLVPQTDSSVNDTTSSVDWFSCLQAADWCGEEVYTINIQPTSDYLDIRPCKLSATNLLHICSTL